MISKNQIKFIKSLSLKKNRVKAQLFVAEGEKIVNELLNSKFEIEHIYSTKQFSGINSRYKSAITLITNDELSRISNLTSPNNVLAIARVKQKELENNTITIRKLGSEKQETIKREDLIKNMLSANKLPLN